MIEEGPDRDHDYSDDEKQQLTARLLQLTTAVHRGHDGPIVDRARLCEIHRELFGGVRGHAGRMRDRDWGSEYLVFGPNRSVRRHDVHEAVDKVYVKLRQRLPMFEERSIDEDYVGAAIQLAALTHAELIRIHPFEDGNGRTSRLQLTSVLVALRLPPVAFDAVKQEYNAALNSYFEACKRAAQHQHPTDLAALGPLSALLAEQIVRRS